MKGFMNRPLKSTLQTYYFCLISDRKGNGDNVSPEFNWQIQFWKQGKRYKKEESDPNEGSYQL